MWYLSMIVEGREDNDEFGDVGGLFGRFGENRYRRLNWRVYLCSDIIVVGNREYDVLVFFFLVNFEKNER